MITMPNADSHNARVLQEDNTELAYEFARKFPGYTAENLSEKGVSRRTQSNRLTLVDSYSHTMLAGRSTRLPRAASALSPRTTRLCQPSARTLRSSSAPQPSHRTSSSEGHSRSSSSLAPVLAQDGRDLDVRCLSRLSLILALYASLLAAYLTAARAAWARFLAASSGGSKASLASLLASHVALRLDAVSGLFCATSCTPEKVALALRVAARRLLTSGVLDAATRFALASSLSAARCRLPPWLRRSLTSGLAFTAAIFCLYSGLATVAKRLATTDGKIIGVISPPGVRL